MRRKLRRGAQAEGGFTLIEILVTILIVGILAAVAIAAFLGQRGKAYDAQAKSNLRTAQTAEETYAADNDGTYTAAATSDGASDPLVKAEPALANPPYVTAELHTGGYTLTATSAGGRPITYTISITDGAVTHSCTPIDTNGCDSYGHW